MSRLCAAGCEVIASVRRANPQAEARLAAYGARVVWLELGAPETVIPFFTGVDAVVITAHLTLAAPYAPALRDAGVARAVFFSSNNVSADPYAVESHRLGAAECEVVDALPQATILRPTLIYGDPRLLTVVRLVEAARRGRVLPVPGWGAARTQPVFHDDLGAVGAACVLDARPGIFSVGGPDVVTMRAFYRAIVRAAGSSSFVAPVPRAALALGDLALRAIRRPSPLTADQIARVDRDRVAAPGLLAELAPTTRLDEGLRRLVAMMDA